MVRILAVTPISVPDQELVRRQRRYDALAPAGVEVQLHNLGGGPTGVPHALETDDDVAASEAAVTGWFRAAVHAGTAEGFDAFLPDCVLDPGVGSGTADLPLPVLGLLRLNLGVLSGAGGTISAVARNQAIARELQRKAGEYGPVGVGPVTVLGLALEDIADDDAWTAAVAAALPELPAGYTINACSAVNLGQLPAGGPALVDPTALALRLIGVLAGAGAGAGVSPPVKAPGDAPVGATP
ncbi:MAG: hypothetical protein ABS909_04500 [Arthrobacter sp.]